MASIRVSTNRRDSSIYQGVIEMAVLVKANRGGRQIHIAVGNDIPPKNTAFFRSVFLRMFGRNTIGER